MLRNRWVIRKLDLWWQIFGKSRGNNADCKRQGRNYVWTTGKPFHSELQDLASTRGRLTPALTCTCARVIQIQCFVIYTFTVHACVLALPRLPNKTLNTHVLDSFKPRECLRIRGLGGGVSIEMRGTAGATLSRFQSQLWLCECCKCFRKAPEGFGWCLSSREARGYLVT